MISRSCSRERTFRDDGQAPGVRQLGAKGVGGPRPHDGIVRQSSDDRPSSSDLASPTMTVPRKKLIEVALPLEAINKASARESFIYRGNPSAIHKWWAQRPLAAINEALRSEEHTSELQSPDHLVCRLLLEKKTIQQAPTCRGITQVLHP